MKTKPKMQIFCSNLEADAALGLIRHLAVKVSDETDLAVARAAPFAHVRLKTTRTMAHHLRQAERPGYCL